MKSVHHKNNFSSVFCNLGRFDEASYIDTIGVFPASQVPYKDGKPHRSAYQTQLYSNLRTKPFSRLFQNFRLPVATIAKFLNFGCLLFRLFQNFSNVYKVQRASQLKSKLRDSAKHLCVK